MSGGPVVWIPRRDEGPLGPGEKWSPLGHGGPHHGTISLRERRAYRFTFSLALWLQASMLVTMWALRFVYAGAQSPIAPVFGAVGGAMVLLMALGIGPAYAALGAARAEDPRGGARRVVPLVALALLVLGGLAFEWQELGLPRSGRLGEIWYVTNALFGAQLLGTGLVAAGLAASALRGRSGEFAFDGLRMQWLYLTVAFTLTYVIDYAF